MFVKFKLSPRMVFISILSIPLIICYYLVFGNYPPYRPIQQRLLANQLGIETENLFPHPYFPLTHYGKILTKDMTVADVHQLIQGYTQVFQCGNVESSSSEIYYYYSTSDNTALRFEVEYKEGKFVWIEGEDEDWRTIRTKDCRAGQLPEVE